MLNTIFIKRKVHNFQLTVASEDQFEYSLKMVNLVINQPKVICEKGFYTVNMVCYLNQMKDYS